MGFRKNSYINSTQSNNQNKKEIQGFLLIY
jgi:hypothetical protein